MTLKVDHHCRVLGSGWDLPTASPAPLRASIREQHGSKVYFTKVVFLVFVLSCDVWKWRQFASWWTRHYMLILGPTNPPFSRWSWYPHPVRQSKLDNLFTYLSSRRVDSSKRHVNVHIMVSWGRTACAAHRFLGSCFSSCMIMTICSGQVMGQAWYVVKTYVRTWSEQQWDKTHAPHSQ